MGHKLDQYLTETHISSELDPKIRLWAFRQPEDGDEAIISSLDECDNVMSKALTLTAIYQNLSKKNQETDTKPEELVLEEETVTLSTGGNGRRPLPPTRPQTPITRPAPRPRTPPATSIPPQDDKSKGNGGIQHTIKEGPFYQIKEVWDGLPKLPILIGLGVLVVIVVGILVVPNLVGQEEPAASNPAVPEALVPDAFTNPSNPEAIVPSVPESDSPKFVAPTAPTSERSIGFSTTPFKGLEQWQQLAALLGLLATLSVDARNQYQLLKNQLNDPKKIKSIQLMASLVAGIIGVGVITFSGTIFKGTDLKTSHILGGVFGTVFIGLGWLIRGFDKSYLGTILAIQAAAYMVIPNSCLAFFHNYTADFFNFGDTYAAISNNQWALATRSLNFYAYILIGALLILSDIIRRKWDDDSLGDDDEGIFSILKSGLKKAAPYIPAVAIPVALNLHHLMPDYFTQHPDQPWGIVIILLAILVNAFLDPEGADEGTALGIALGLLTMAAKGTVLN